MLKNAIIVGGSGQAGTLLVRSMLASGIEVTEVDLHPAVRTDPKHRYLQADVSQCGTEVEQAIRSADCTCICLPEQIALHSASRIVNAMPDRALWVDTLSVKGPILERLQARARPVEILSINPMFAPALGWRGHSVAVVEAGQAGAKARSFKELLMRWGASVQIVTADEHDRLTAALQVATHAAALAFGSVLLGLDYNVEAALALATPPHRIMLGLLYRIVSQNPEVYWDIQAYHPHAARVREDLSASLANMEALVKHGDIDEFKQLFQKLRSLLAPRDETLSELTTRLIAATKQES